MRIGNLVTLFGMEMECAKGICRNGLLACAVRWWIQQHMQLLHGLLALCA